MDRSSDDAHSNTGSISEEIEGAVGGAESPKVMDFQEESGPATASMPSEETTSATQTKNEPASGFDRLLQEQRK